MGKNKKKYSPIGKVDNEMKGVVPMDEKDFDQNNDATTKEEPQMEEKKHPIKDFVAAHKTGLKMAGLGILTFAVGALCGAAGNRNDAKGQKWGIRRDDSSAECPDLIEIDDEQDNVTTEDETTDSTVETTEV